MRERMLDLWRPRALVLTIVATTVLTAALAGSASAATTTLDSLNDEVPVATNGVCTLREAINEANVNSPISETGGADDCRFSGQLGHDVINLPSGTITIAGEGGGEDENFNGDFDVMLNNANSLVINGGAGGTTIDAGGKDRIFDQQTAGVGALGDRHLTLRDMTLTGGSTGGSGGGIRFTEDFQDTATLDLERVHVVGNESLSGSGGGIAVRSAVVRITDGSVDGNSLTSSVEGAVGGGIFVTGEQPTRLEAIRTSFDDNTYDATNPSFQYRRAAGVFLGSTSGAQAQPSFIVDGSISDNELILHGEGVARGGGLYAQDHSLTLRRVLIAGNHFSGTSTREHGMAGAYLDDESQIADNTFTLENVTVANNDAQTGTPAGYTWTGGIALSGGITKVVNSTIAGNVAFSGSQMYLSRGFTAGGGNQTGGSLDIRGTIVDGGTHEEPCDNFGPQNFTHSNNIDSNDTCGFSGLAGGAPGATGDRENIPSATIGLAPLADNGGLSRTQALLPGSVALDAIPPASCLDTEGSALATDQRGAARPEGAGCDIGAFEAATCGGEALTEVGLPGDDTITGTPGADVIATYGGNDTISGLGGDDVICGGDGADTLDYSAESAGVTVDLTAGTATGPSSGSDEVTGVENILGSASADTLTGDSAGNLLTGGLGADTISGLDGPDDIRVRDAGADSVACGDGADFVEGDSASVDSIASDCETLDLTALEEPPSGLVPPPPAPPKTDPPPAAKKPNCKKIKNKKKRKKCIKKLRARK